MSHKHKVRRAVRREVQVQLRQQMVRLRMDTIARIRHEIEADRLSRELDLEDEEADRG